MSRLIFEGDIFNSLGDKFPNIYFSNVSVFDETINIELNGFVEEVVLNHIEQELKVYLVPIYNDNDYQKIISDPDNLISNIYDIRESNFPSFTQPSDETTDNVDETTSPSGAENITDPTAEIVSSTTTTPTATPTTPMGTITSGDTTSPTYFIQFLIENYEKVATRNYNSNNNQYYKLVARKQIVNFPQELAKLDYLSFVTFTSFLTPQEIEDKAIRQDFDSFVLDEVSNISFCRTVVDRKVVNEPFIAYLNGEEKYYGPVLKSLNGTYRANNLEQFEKLLENITQTNQVFTNSGDQQLQSFVDSSAFIVETQKMKIDFLTQIKSLLDSFPRRTNVSRLGVFYTQLKEQIFAFNDFLSRQLRLEKKIITTNYNFDFRNTSDTVLLDTRVPYDSLYRLRNSDFSFYNEEFIYNPFMDRTRRFLSPDRDQLCYNHTYFLFDYEKALYKTSNISQIFNVDEVNMYFGNNCLAPYFQFYVVTYERLSTFMTWGGGTTTACAIDATFNNIEYNTDSSPDLSLALNVQQSSNITTLHELTTLRKGNVLVESGGSATERLDTLIAQRNFDTIESIGEYKLACFEVGDLQMRLDTPTAYKFKVDIKDYTANFVIDKIIRPARAALAGIEDYYDLASDFCSYNDLDGKFNDFFIDSIGERYAASAKPPWELAPIWYNILSNLLTKNNIEDTSATLIDSIQMQVITISPFTGNLNNIERFMQIYKSLLSNFEEGGRIYEQIYGGTHADGTPSGNGLIDNIDTAYIRNFEDLPPILDRNVSSYVTEYECFENVEKFNRSKQISVVAGRTNITFKKMLRLVDKNMKDLFGFNIVQDREGRGDESQSGSRGTGASSGVTAILDTKSLSSALGNNNYNEKINLAFAYFFWLGRNMIDSESFVNDMRLGCESYADRPNIKREIHGNPIPEHYRQTLTRVQKDKVREQTQMIINTMQYIRQLARSSNIDALSDELNLQTIMRSIKGGTIDDEKLTSITGICSDATEGTFLEILDGIRLLAYNTGAGYLLEEFITFYSRTDPPASA
jgi:hypothetical protein